MGATIISFDFKTGQQCQRFDEQELERDEWFSVHKEWIEGSPRIISAQTRFYFSSFELFSFAGLVSSKTEMKKFSPKINGVGVSPDTEVIEEDFIHALAFHKPASLLLEFGRNTFHLELSKKKQGLVRIGQNLKKLS